MEEHGSTSRPTVRLSEVPEWLRRISGVCKSLKEEQEQDKDEEDQDVQFALPVCDLDSADGETLYAVMHAWGVDWCDVPYRPFLEKWFHRVAPDRRRELLADSRAFGHELDVDNWRRNMFQRDDLQMYTWAVFARVLTGDQKSCVEACIRHGAVKCLAYELQQLSGSTLTCVYRYTYRQPSMPSIPSDNQTMYAIELAAFLGQLGVVQCLIDNCRGVQVEYMSDVMHRYSGYPMLAQRAAQGGQTALVNWAIDRQPELFPLNGGETLDTEITGEHLVAAAAQSGSLSLVQMLVLERKVPFTQSYEPIAFAAGAGHLHIVEWLHAQGAWYHSSAFRLAAKHGHVPVLEWLFAHRTDPMDPSWKTDMCVTAAEHGQLEALKWARAHGCKWNEYWTLCAAAKRGHLEIIRWARQGQRTRSQVCPWGNCTLQCAQRNGCSAEVLAYLRENGCPATVEDGARKKRPKYA